MKSQFKRADASGARFALIFGEEETREGLVSVKPLREAAGEQNRLPLDSPARWAEQLRVDII
jgi:histidyl-tRNA synthetase